MDSCSSVSIMTEKLAKALNLDITYENDEIKCANDTSHRIIGKATLIFQLGHKYIAHDFYIAVKQAFPCIIGNDIEKIYGVVKNPKRDLFYFDDMPHVHYPLLDGCEKLLFLMQPTVSLPKELTPSDPYELELQHIIAQYPTVCRTDGTIGQTDLIVHKIELTKDEIMKERPRMFTGIEAVEIQKQCKALLEQGLIRESMSPYGFNVVLDKKQDGSFRMTVNYKKINKITKPNATPMHNANLILRLLPTGHIFSKIDLKSGFWQIKMDESSVEKTAFYGNGILYEFLVMPFGLVSAPATFVTLMNRVLRDYIYKFCFIYMDDIIVFSKDKDDNLRHVKMIFEKLKEARLSINLAKSSFLKTSIEYLGHIVSGKGIKANPRKVRDVLEMPDPQNKKELHTLSGLCSYLSDFIPHLSVVLSPITKLLKKNVPFVWESEQKRALQAIRKILTEDIMLEGINFDFPLYLRTDASDKGMGCILCQEIDGRERVVAYASKKFKDSEFHLSAVEKECKAILYGLKRFAEFFGSEKIIVYTDNKALTHLKSHHPNNRNLTRWSHIIEERVSEIKYFEGKRNVLADVLSRLCAEDDINEPDQLDDIPEKAYVPMLALTYFGNVLEKIRDEQRKDKNIQEIIATLNSSQPVRRAQTASQPYVMKNELLYRCVLPFPGSKTDSNTSVSNKRLIGDSDDLVDTEKDLRKDDRHVHASPSSNVVHGTRTSRPPDGAASENVLKDDDVPLNLCIKDNRSPSIAAVQNVRPSSGQSPNVAADKRKKKDNDSNVQRSPSSNDVVETTLASNDLTYLIVPVVPDSLKEEIITYFHTSPEFGHFGRKKTIDNIKRRFYWCNMNKDIATFVKSCQTCQQYKSENLKKKGLMGLVPIANHVFETIYLDFIGPLVCSKYRRNRFILVLVDQLSGWVELSSMPTATTKRVTDFLEDIFCHFGCPKAIVTDNGSNFTSKLMKQFCKERNINHVLTAAYHPCPNRSERTNKDVVRMISCYVEDKHDLWDMHLQHFALALRTAVNETTGVTPALLNLGREISLPIDRELNPEISLDYEKDAKEIAKTIPTSMSTLINDVKSRIKHVQEVNKFYHDEKVRHCEFNVGDYVWVRNHQLSDAANKVAKKFAKKWIGPYKIILKRDLTYCLQMPKHLVDKRHVSDLKAYTAPPEKSAVKLLPIKEIVQSNEPVNLVKERLRPRKPINYSEKRKK